MYRLPACNHGLSLSFTHSFHRRPTLVLLMLGIAIASSLSAAEKWTLVGWNNLGMHCMDSDYSVFSILPPYNTVHAQLIHSTDLATRLVTAPGTLGVAYQAWPDPSDSLNTTSVGKGNFWDYSLPLYGVALQPDQGLPVPGPNSFSMPGSQNLPQAMQFETNFNWFAAYGVPITPYDDLGRPNQYPLMRLAAREGGVAPMLASARVVLPVSDEMDCKLCHASGSGIAARPPSGWVNLKEQGRDYRLNILRLHDATYLFFYQDHLTALGFHTNGLYDTVTKMGRPILCASCHLSEALPGSGRPGIPPLTRSIHALHAGVVDPRNGLTLDSSANRDACYACHPGSVTRCLRGAMGKAIAPDGTPAMQCQSCHGSMSDVGRSTRTGWLHEPNCQACHTGDAVNNAGQIRFRTVFTATGEPRVVTNRRFATNLDTPAPGLSLYRFSRGHGGLQCSACHGSTHAEYPALLGNDNLQSTDIQGHVGVVAECTSCHVSSPNTISGGPHGMHPVNASWANSHDNQLADAGLSTTQCQVCHGVNYRGTVLSRAFADRTFQTEFGAKQLHRGARVGCYLCHNGPNEDNASPNTPPTVASGNASANSGVPKTVQLSGTDANGNSLTYRVVSEPAHGTVALSGATATYTSEPGFAGTDSFSFMAEDADSSSNPGTISMNVSAPDGDSDGLPDWWTRRYFGHPDGQASDHSRATDDPDGDGATNLAEYHSATDPSRRSSALTLAQVKHGPMKDRVTFNTVLGQSYDLLGAATVLGPWLQLATNVWGHPDSVTVEVSPEREPAQFFRARIREKGREVTP